MTFRSALISGAQAMGIQVSPEVVEGLEAHHLLMLKWGAKINLTSVKDPVAAAYRHGLDSLLFAELIPPEDEALTLDVGSGAGFPGIPLALARPDLRLTLLEPLRKRASFLRTVLADLGLKKVQVEEAKLEAIDTSWELIVSRATLAPAKLAQAAAPRLLPGGRLIVTAGGDPEDPAVLTADTELVHRTRQKYQLPDGALRCLDVLVRRSPPAGMT